jgi:MoxR-like ATPase
VRYPNFNEEFEIARRTTALAVEELIPVLSGDQILDLQRLVRRVPVTDHVIQYTLALVRQTRVGEPGVPKFMRDWLAWGAGPRAVQYLILGGKARALLNGRAHVQCEDIQALALPVLRHRILTNFTAASEGITPDTVIDKLVRETPSREGELTRDERFKKIFAS